MIAIILTLITFSSIIFMAVIGVVVFFHFKRFALPDDKLAKKILSVFELGSLIIILLNVYLWALIIIKS